MKKAQLLSPCLWVALAAAAFAQDPLSYARVISDPKYLDQATGLDAHAVHLARADDEAALAALGDGAVDSWLRARIAMRRGEPGSAHHALRALAHSEQLAQAALSQNLLRHLDYDRAEAAFAAGHLQPLLAIFEESLVPHRDDALWLAHRARAQWATGQDASQLFAEASAAASESMRRRPVFAWRALALLDQGEQQAAAEAWLEHVEGLRWPQELRAAIELFDSQPRLAETLDRDGLRERSIRFYARILRREQGLALAERGLASDDGDEVARCFVLGAEQLYRLRRHAELDAWLKRPWPSAVEDEGRASLMAYPWGVRRRSGASVEIAEAFDGIWHEYSDTERGLEALWESAWMFELSDRTLDAEKRFLEYATRQPRGPLASAAAARAIGLPARRGDDALVVQRFEDLLPALQNRNDLATARWLATEAARRLGSEPVIPLDSTQSNRLRHDPFAATIPHPWATRPAVGADQRELLLQEILRLQALSFQRVASELDIDLRAPLEPPLADAAELYRLGLFLEGDYILNAAAASSRQVAASQLRAAWLAWRMGRSERQARVAFQLSSLLEDRDSAQLQRALDRIGHPTPFARDVLESADELSLPGGLLWAIMRRESFYDPAVISLAGAYGLLQLLPSTAGQMAAKLGDPEPDTEALRQALWNLRYGSAYMRQLVDESGGDLYRALAAYNAGEANGKRWAARRDDSSGPESMLFLISYSETRGYVYHVLRFWRLYGNAYPSLGAFDQLEES